MDCTGKPNPTCRHLGKNSKMTYSPSMSHSCKIVGRHRSALMILPALFLALSISVRAQSASIKTTFLPTATLSTNEIEIVAQLAYDGGMTNVAEILTTQWILSGPRQIFVRGTARTNGRDSEVDDIEVYNSNWDNKQPPPNTRMIGTFWAC